MRKETLIYLALVIPLLFISACKKKDEPVCPEYQIPIDAAYDAWKFLPGSYWVYQDDSTGALDSVYITNTSTGTEDVQWNCSSGTSSYDYFEMEFAASASTPNNWYLYNGAIALQDRGGLSVAIPIWFSGTPGQTGGLLEFGSSGSHTGYGSTQFIGQLDSLNVAGQVYTDVDELETDPWLFVNDSIPSVRNYFWTEDGPVKIIARSVDDPNLVLSSASVIRMNVLR